MVTMYELVGQYNRLLEVAEDVDSDCFEDTLQSIKDDVKGKASAYVAIIFELQAEADKRKKEADRLTKQQHVYENRVRRLQQNLQYSMTKTGIKRVQAGLHVARIQNNPPHAVIEDEQKIPVDFLKTEYRVDKKKILEALKADHEVPGARIESSQSLRIR